MRSKSLFLVFVVVVVNLLENTLSLKSGDFFKICSRNDPNLNTCIKSSLEQLLPTLKKGIPSLKISSVDPMHVKKINIVQGSGAVSMDSNFIDTQIDGITTLSVRSVKADLDNYKIDVKVAIPYLYVSGDYEMKGRILFLPIVGKGDSWSNYTDVTGTASLIGHPETRDGKIYMRLDEFKFGIDVKRALIHMNNLFNGNKQLGEFMNTFMANNWEIVFAELKPVVDEAISILLKDVATKVFDTFPFDTLFPCAPATNITA